MQCSLSVLREIYLTVLFILIQYNKTDCQISTQDDKHSTLLTRRFNLLWTTKGIQGSIQ